MPTYDKRNRERTPALHSPRFDCPHCGAFAGQAWSDLGIEGVDSPWEHLDGEWKESASGAPSFISAWHCAQCASCTNWSIWRHGTMIYPQGRVGSPPHAEMPPDVRELYEEAAAIAQVSRRAGAAMARAAVERLIRGLDPDAPKRAPLAARIQRLRGQVSTPLGQLLDVIRVTGNGVLHQDDSPDEIVILALDDKDGPEVLTLLLAAINDLVDELITRPRVANELWEKLPVTIRERSQSPAETPDGNPR